MGLALLVVLTSEPGEQLGARARQPGYAWAPVVVRQTPWWR